MPKTYLIATIAQVHDEAGFGEYRKAAIPTVQQYGARPIVVADTVERLEGDQAPQRVVVLEFDDMEHAKRWYQSPEYSAAIPLRQKSAITSLVLAEGLS